MPRKKRLCLTGMCHHVMLRGIDGRPTFIDDRDRNRFCLLLQEASEMHLFRIHAFCFMTNHIHLILEPTTELLANCVHRFASRYAQYFNKRHNRRGYVFQGRFRSIIVKEGSYLQRLVRYIHLNPVEAKLIHHPEQYPWSSHNAYFGRVTYTWLNTNRVLSHFGDTRSEALDNMDVYLRKKIEAKIDGEEIVKAYRSGVYGDEEFAEIYMQKEYLLKPELEDNIVHGIELLLEAVSNQFGVTLDELRSSDKRRELVKARAILARGAQLLNGQKLSNVCEVLQKHHGTISRLAAVARNDHELNNLSSRLVEGLC